MFNRTIKAATWLEGRLLTAQDHRELEQLVLLEGRAKGFSPDLLRRVAADHRFERTDGWWGITALRLEALEIRAQLAQGTWQPAPQVVPATAGH